MTEKPGRNDLCPCKSGKKYKNCCMSKAQSTGSALGKRKFTAKVISGGGVNKVENAEQEQNTIKGVDYATLLERSYGAAVHEEGTKPPKPTNPLQYLPSQEGNDPVKE